MTTSRAVLIIVAGMLAFMAAWAIVRPWIDY